MADIINWQQDDQHEVVLRVLDLLGRGQLVAFSSEAGYDVVANALAPEAVSRLAAAVPRQSLTVALSHPAEALDWVPGLSGLGQRLGRRSWPGLLTLVCDSQVNSGLASRLPESVRQLLWVDGAISLRMPEHKALRLVLSLVDRPLVLGTITSGTTPQDFDHEIALAIEDGLLRSGKAPSKVRVLGKQWQLLQEGALSEAEVEELVPCRILFVCTGNTCRSPLAQALCAKLLAERLGCAIQDLPRHGFVVQSAGLVATPGGLAAPEAMDVAREFGADLDSHRSQPLTFDLLSQVDHLFAMTHSHMRALLSQGLDWGPEPRLLSPQGHDVSDPIGGSLEVYRECAQQILEYLQELVPQLED